MRRAPKRNHDFTGFVIVVLFWNICHFLSDFWTEGIRFKFHVSAKSGISQNGAAQEPELQFVTHLTTSSSSRYVFPCSWLVFKPRADKGCRLNTEWNVGTLIHFWRLLMLLSRFLFPKAKVFVLPPYQRIKSKNFLAGAAIRDPACAKNKRLSSLLHFSSSATFNELTAWVCCVDLLFRLSVATDLGIILADGPLECSTKSAALFVLRVD